MIWYLTILCVSLNSMESLGVSCKGWVQQSMVCHTEVMTWRKVQASKFSMYTETQIGSWNTKEKRKTANTICICMNLNEIHKGQMGSITWIYLTLLWFNSCTLFPYSFSEFCFAQQIGKWHWTLFPMWAKVVKALFKLLQQTGFAVKSS